MLLIYNIVASGSFSAKYCKTSKHHLSLKNKTPPSLPEDGIYQFISQKLADYAKIHLNIISNT